MKLTSARSTKGGTTSAQDINLVNIDYIWGMCMTKAHLTNDDPTKTYLLANGAPGVPKLDLQYDEHQQGLYQ
ncbi:hypothetical protein DPMN_020228 [Dreissena polymorpha]|uniref:Uncharacterized protein n=1 Tax=Dreissena polymorpha TaxID=45954 RepID=A0A9D4SA05_DREPO|nr:hypothetical protein DPMN_020228 [Dreissena polymorpha]